MQEGTYTFYAVQAKTVQRSPWCKPREPLEPVPDEDSKWFWASWDTFGHGAEPWAGQGNDYKPVYPASHAETHACWAATGSHGWWTLKYAMLGLRRLRAASEQMTRRAAALAGDLQKEGRWQAVFTADQVNGWLAVELGKRPEMLPGAVRDPRVAIQPQQLTVACRYKDSQIDTVLSLTVDAYLAEPNVIALRIRKARAGSLPLPLDRVLQEVSRATDQLDWQVDWRQAAGDPVALVRMPAVRVVSTAPRTAARGGSIMPNSPTKIKSCSTASSDTCGRLSNGR